MSYIFDSAANLSGSPPSNSEPVSSDNSIFAELSTEEMDDIQGESSHGEIMSLRGASVGSYFVLVTEADIVCGGIIGAGGKFCCRVARECEVIKYTKTCFEVKAGLYLKASDTDAFITPFVEIKKIPSSLFQSLLARHFGSKDEARAHLQFLMENELKEEDIATKAVLKRED